MFQVSKTWGVCQQTTCFVFAAVCVSPCPAPTGADVLFQVSGGTQRCLAKVEVQGYAGGEEGLSVERGSDLWIKFIRKREQANLLLQEQPLHNLGLCVSVGGEVTIALESL